MPEAETDLNKTIQKVLGMMTRRRWWILLPAAVTIFGTYLVLSLIPNRYTSEAILLVVQQQIPQRFVLPTTTIEIREALQATTQEVLSRNRLLGIIDEFGLYAKERGRVSPETLLGLMRNDIQIQTLENQSERSVNSFKISFMASEPQVAQKVTIKLTSLFIEQNLETREHQATTTTNFLRDQLEATKKKLVDAEEQVRTFKMQHLGELPEEQQVNLAILGGVQGQLVQTMTILGRAKEQREYLQALIGYRVLAIEGDLANLKAEKTSMLDRYTSRHPAVVKLDEKIAQKEAFLKALRDSRGPGTAKGRAEPFPYVLEGAAVNRIKPEATIPLLVSPVTTDFDMSVVHLRSQLDANRQEIENLSRDEDKLKAAIEQYQRRLNLTPMWEQQLTGILRNYDQLKQDYADLLNKEQQSRMAADLEKRQEGQQFRLVDRPSLPTVPSSPNRRKISVGGGVAGIGLGLALALFMDIRSRSYHSEEDLEKHLALPLVISVPLLLTSYEERARMRKRVFEWVAASALALAVFGVEFCEFYLYRHG